MSQGLRVAVRELTSLIPVLLAPRRSRSATDARALQGVRDQLADARAHVAWYRDPAYAVRLDTLADLAALPLLTKSILRERGTELFASDAIGWYQTDQTSGSTGAVVRIRHDAAAYGYHGATVLRRFIRSGYLPWWRIAQIKPFPRPHRWFQSIGLFRRTVVSSRLTDTEVTAQVLAAGPQLLMGYPVMLRTVLRTLTDAQREQLRSTLRLVFTDSELVTEAARLALQEEFGVPVCDEYSAYEVLTIGAHCRQGRMHVDEDRVILEIVDEHGDPVPDGTEGIVVVTHFRERAMPLLRYQVGDRAVRDSGHCRCGNRFRTMTLTSGRTEDYVTVPGGRRIYIPTFVGIGITTPGLAEFMVRQDAVGVITVHVVLEPGADFDAVEAKVRTDLAGQVSPDLLRVLRADALDISAGGKARLIHSDYRPDYRPESPVGEQVSS